MNSPGRSRTQESGNSERMRSKAAAIWLFLVAVATILNSLILFRCSRFIDFLIGLTFAQFIDAIVLGLQLEPKGAPWLATAVPALLLDVPLVALLFVLSVKVSRGHRLATQISFWIYAIDTLLVAASFAASATILHVPIRVLAWQNLTPVVHAIGLIILFRAWRASVSARFLHNPRN
jgi:hypothetical protein